MLAASVVHDGIVNLGSSFCNDEFLMIWIYIYIYIYMYCMYIYNRVICKKFSWNIYGIYMALFFLNNHISLILNDVFFSRTKEELSQHKGDWRAQQAAHASGGSVSRTPEVSAVSASPSFGTGRFTVSMDGHVFNVKVGKHTRCHFEHMGRVIGWCMMNTCCWFYSWLLSEML